MRYQISELRLTPEEYKDREHRLQILRRKLMRRLKRMGVRTRGIGIQNIEVIRESIDARKKPAVQAVYTIAFDCGSDLPLKEAKRTEYRLPELPEEARKSALRPVIAGFGPCGMFAALTLAEAGLAPIVLERGKPVEERMRDVLRFWQEGVLDPESNVQFGEGGAGTFSDGKLTTGVRDPRIRRVLEVFAECGADPEILYQHKPHIGTDRLQEIVPRIREKVISLGGEIRFRTKLAGIETEQTEEFCGQDGARQDGAGQDPAGKSGQGRLCAVLTEQTDDSGNKCKTRIETDQLILAVGHSAEDTFRMLYGEGMAMRQKPFSIGVRIEHPQEMIDRAQYGDPQLAQLFGPASYKLHHRCGSGRGVYTFCMCPGGKVINASSGPGQAVTNGMSESARDGALANSGLLVDVRTEDFGSDDPLAGFAFQKHYERLAWQHAGGRGLPVSTYGSFRDNERDPVRSSLPAFAAEGILESMPHLGRQLKGFDDENARMTAVETRSSSPVRVDRDERYQSSIRGILPAGEGPGHAGGIMSAAADGIRTAEQVILAIGEAFGGHRRI